jgi:cell wall-associated NlpC family hydrolase
MKNNRKYIKPSIITGILSVSLFTGAGVIPDTASSVQASSTFSDTYQTPWAAPSIESLYEKNIIKGVSPGTFAPNESVTRAEFAAMLARAVNKPEKINGFPFGDVSANKWYYEPVKKAYEMGIVKGVSATDFSPERPITREEAAVIIAHTFNYSHSERALPYHDKEKVSDWAVDSVKAVTEKNVFSGDDGYFFPQKLMTRAEVAVVLHKALYGYVPKPAPERKVASRSSYRLDELFMRKVEPLLGTPYRWGGTSPSSGFDCSGFTRYVYNSLGVDLPRTSSQQFTEGTKVSMDEMQPGDLIFFDTGSGSISHVGIYMGNGKMAHAASGQGEVTINNIDWYVEHYRVVGVKRYL